MRRIFLFTAITLFVCSTVFGLDFRTTLNVSCGSDAATAVIGVAPDARNGIDAYDLPYFGFPPAFALYFETSDSGLSLNLVTDIRFSGDSIQIWDGTTVMETSSQIVIRWSPSSFPADSGELKIGYHLPGDTVEEWFDMTEVDSIAYNVGNRIQIVLRHEVPTYDDTISPEIISWSISDGDTIHDSVAVLSVIVVDTNSGVDTSSVSMTLNSIPITFFLDDSSYGDTVMFSYSPLLSYRDTNWVVFSISDFAGNMTSDSITFYYADSTDTSSGYVISGMVFLSGGATTLSGTKVMVSELGITETTNTMGQFSLDPLPCDTYTILFDREDYIPVDTVIYLEYDTTIMVTLESSGGEGITVSGLVILEGETDFSGSIVSLNTFGVDTIFDTTDASGNYEFLLPSPGFFTIKAEHTGFRTDSLFVIALNDTIINFSLVSSSIREHISGNDPISLAVLSAGGDGIMFRCENVRKISIFDISGRSIRKFDVPSGKSEAFWNYRDEFNRYVPAGVYFIRAAGSDFSITKKIILLQ